MQGFPWDRSKEGMDFWRSGVKAMSNEPNTYIKLSEFGVKGQDWNFLQNKEIILELIDCLGLKDVCLQVTFLFLALILLLIICF